MDKIEIIEDLVNREEYEAVLKILLDIEKNEEPNYWLYCNLGWVLGRLNRREEALEYLKKAEQMGSLMKMAGFAVSLHGIMEV